MPVPKKKTSRSNRDKRRTHKKLHPVTFVSCAQCGEPRLPHHACTKCGYYRQGVEVPVKEVKEK